MPTKILVLAEHDNHTLKNATLNTLSAAQQLSQDITVLVLGFECRSVAEQVAKLAAVKHVLWCDASYYQWALAEEMAEAIKHIVKFTESEKTSNATAPFTHLLAPATTFGKNILPRAAALLGVGQISDVTKIISEDTFVRPIYAGNALVTVQSLDPIKVLTMRPTQFDASDLMAQMLTIVSTEASSTKASSTKASSAESSSPESSPIESISPPPVKNLSQCIHNEDSVSSRPELSSAKIVISGGRGLQSRENFKILEDLADKLGAAVGASRAAVDAGYVPNDYQVGQTGKVVAPDLYMAVGISGAIQHLSGMKDSKVIVAINKDPEAPIFQVADYGLVGDLFQVIPELSQEITIRKLDKIG